MADNNKSTGFSFGSPAAKPGGFSFGAPVQSTPAVAGAAPPAFNVTASPGSGFAFGAPAPSTIPTAAVAPTPSGGLSFGGFGAPAAATVVPLTTAAAPAVAPLSLGFGKPLAAAPTTGFTGFGATAAAPATSAPPAFSGFSMPAASTVTTTATALSAPAKTLPTLGGSLGLPAATAATTAATSSLTLPGLSATPAAATVPSTTATAITNPLTNLTTSTTTTQSAATTAQPAGTQLNFCQLEEHINKWTLELEEQEKMFTNQATQINAWDRVLIENSDKIVALNDAFHKVKIEQKALEQELEYIAAQHAELDECIKPLEKEMSKSQQFDPEREQTYLMADNLDTQLKQMGEDLKEVIEHLNEANKDRDPNDPIVQIGKILNAHMSSLQWIENSTSHITSKLDNISKLQETLRRDNERSFRMNM